jgi:hemerythrin superfamily protein
VGIKLFDQLQRDHQEIRRMLGTMINGKEKERESVLKSFQKTFIAHLKAEESSFYPNLEDEPETKMLALEAYEEHHVAELVFDELLKLKVTEDEWSAKLKVLTEIIEHHIEEEEGEIFKSAEETFEDDEFSDMYKEFLTKKEAWINRKAA